MDEHEESKLFRTESPNNIFVAVVSTPQWPEGSAGTSSQFQSNIFGVTSNPAASPPRGLFSVTTSTEVVSSEHVGLFSQSQPNSIMHASKGKIWNRYACG